MYVFGVPDVLVFLGLLNFLGFPIHTLPLVGSYNSLNKLIPCKNQRDTLETLRSLLNLPTPPKANLKSPKTP